MRAATCRVGSSPGARASTSTDRDGNRMLDAFAALYCVNAGYGRTEIADAMSEQAHKLAYFHAFAGHGNEPAIRLAKMIMDRAPDHMARVYFGLSGSDANETNVKLAWHYNILRGKPRKAEDHHPLARLSRVGHRVGVADRSRASITRASTCRCRVSCTPTRRTTCAARTADMTEAAVPRLPDRPAGSDDRARRARHHRRLHRRTGDGHGRHHAPARGLLGAGAGGA